MHLSMLFVEAYFQHPRLHILTISLWKCETIVILLILAGSYQNLANKTFYGDVFSKNASFIRILRLQYGYSFSFILWTNHPLFINLTD